MMKNTNNIRIVLQQLNGKPVHIDDFEFAITDDNTLFDYKNDLIANGTITYLPYQRRRIFSDKCHRGTENPIGK